MAQPDLSMKELMTTPEAAADIIDSLLFKGKGIVKAENLTRLSEQELLPDGDKLREKRRDVFHLLELWNGQIFDLVFIGFENQMTVDYDMPLRTMGYDFGTYTEYRELHPKEPLLPVITIVLYFGRDRWTGSRTLFDMFNLSDEAKELLKQWVNDYPLHIVEVGYLTDEEIRELRGVFRTIAKYLTQFYGADYPIHKEPTTHVSEAKRVLNCLGIEVDDNLLENTQEEHNVKTIINGILKEHELEGELRGELRTKRELAATMLTNGATPEQIVALTNLPMDLVQSVQSAAAGN